MMIGLDEYAVVDYRHLTGVLYVNEDGKQIRYSINMTTDRNRVMISRSYSDNGEMVNTYCKEVTRDFLVAASAEFNPLVIWFVRGMWGIPE